MALKQRFTALVSMGFVVGALLACKKKPEAAPEGSAAVTPPPVPSAAPVPTPTPAPTPEPSAAADAAPTTVEAKLGDVKRYGVDKESKLDDSGVRVTADELKVYNEADLKTDDVATLPKGLLVFRQVKMDDFTLVEFPSGIGQFAQGWVETKALSENAEKVTRAAALSEKKTASVKVVDGGAAKPSDAGTDAGAKAKEKEAADAGADKDAEAKAKKDAEAKAKKEADKAEKKEAEAKAKKEAEAKAKKEADKAKKDSKTPPPPPPPPTPDKKDKK